MASKSMNTMVLVLTFNVLILFAHGNLNLNVCPRPLQVGPCSVQLQDLAIANASANVGGVTVGVIPTTSARISACCTLVRLLRLTQANACINAAIGSVALNAFFPGIDFVGTILNVCPTI